MKKRVVSFLLTFVLLISMMSFVAVPASAANPEIYLTYKVENNEAIITQCSEYFTGEMVIPEKLGGYPVTGIDQYAFSDCKYITEIVLPDTVRYISEYAFNSCSSLEKVDMGNQVTEIGKRAFRYCHALKSVIFSENLRVIQFEAFDCCYALESITIPSSVGIIDEGAFRVCSALSEVNLSEGLREIGSYAFSYCSSLPEINIPNSVLYIGASAFYDSVNLAKIHMNFNVLNIGEEAFYGTAYYKDSQNWENESLYLDNYLIAVNGDLTGSYTVKEGTVGIAACVFKDKGLTAITFPNSLKFLSEESFYGCTQLRTINGGDNVSYIGTWAFDYSWFLDDPANWEDGTIYLGKCLLKVSGNPKNFIVRPGTVGIAAKAFNYCSELSSVILPDGLLYIAKEAFFGCNNLHELSMPEGLLSIEYCAVWMKKIILPKSVKYIDDNYGVMDVWFTGFKEDRDKIAFYGTRLISEATWHYRFTDIDSARWAYESIKYCYNRGLMKGTTDWTFNPSGTMTRAALVSTLYRLEGSPEVSGSAGFTDVASNAWYADAVTWASQNGIVSGKGDGRFAPTDPVTRMSFVSILYRYAEYSGEDVSARADLSGFADAGSVPDWASANIEWAVAEGLLSGTTSGNKVNINYSGKATRAQGAVLLQKFCEM